MKKLMILALCAMISQAAIACDNQTAPPSGDKFILQLANPFIDCKDLTCAAKLAKFEITLPSNYKASKIRVIKNEMIEIISMIAENEIRFRKAVGNENISGDYNHYKEINKLSVDGKTITTKGNDGHINTATWTEGNYSFSVGSSDGLSQNEIIAIAKELK